MRVEESPSLILPGVEHPSDKGHSNRRGTKYGGFRPTIYPYSFRIYQASFPSSILVARRVSAGSYNLSRTILGRNSPTNNARPFSLYKV